MATKVPNTQEILSKYGRKKEEKGENQGEKDKV